MKTCITDTIRSRSGSTYGGHWYRIGLRGKIGVIQKSTASRKGPWRDVREVSKSVYDVIDKMSGDPAWDNAKDIADASVENFTDRGYIEKDHICSELTDVITCPVFFGNGQFRIGLLGDCAVIQARYHTNPTRSKCSAWRDEREVPKSVYDIIDKISDEPGWDNPADIANASVENFTARGYIR